MTSADSKNRAACRANRAVSTAPIAKFGTTITPSSGLAASHWRIVSSRSSVKPDVPVMMWMFWSRQNRMWSITTSGWVKSTTTWLPASASENNHSRPPTAATRSMSSASMTACEVGLAHPAARTDHPDAQQLVGHWPALGSYRTLRAPTARLGHFAAWHLPRHRSAHPSTSADQLCQLGR